MEGERAIEREKDKGKNEEEKRSTLVKENFEILHEGDVNYGLLEYY